MTIFNPKVNIMVTSKRLDERGFVSGLCMFTLVFLIHEIQLKECNRHRTEIVTTLN